MFFDETAQEYCRMSWFLIETDEGLCLGSNKQPNGKRFLVIIHSMELIDDESDNMYVDRKVRFMWKQGIVEGKIRLASDERDSVDNELKMLQENEAGNVVSQSHKPNNYIVQYRRGTDTIIYRILREKESVEDMQKSVILEDDIPYVAKILYMNESQELLLQELNLLKDKCFEATFTESRDSEKLENDWLLIQYSTGPLNLIYKIINYSDTVWQNENKFKDVVAYITASDVTFQGIVLSKSQDYDELKKTLQVIEKVGLTSAFPLDPFSEAKSFRLLATSNHIREEKEKEENSIDRDTCVINPLCGKSSDVFENHNLKATESLIDLSRLSGGSDRDGPAKSDIVYDYQGQNRESQNWQQLDAEEGQRQRSKSTSSVSPLTQHDTRELANEVKGKQRRHTDTRRSSRKSIKKREPKETILQVIDYTIGEDFVETPKAKEPGHKSEILSLQPTGCDMLPAPVLRDKCARIDYLEEQVLMLRQELSRIKEEFVPVEDLLRFNSLSERLRELNSLLSDLKHNCNRTRFSDYPDDEEALEKHIRTINFDNPPNEVSTSSPPSSPEVVRKGEPALLPSALPTAPEEKECDFTNVPLAMPRNENFKIVNDYRVDPEVRRQRLDKRDQERAQIRCQNHKQQQFPENAEPLGMPERVDSKSKCLRFEWDTSPIPPLLDVDQGQKKATSLPTSTLYVPEAVLTKRTSEVQTDRHRWGPTRKKTSKCSHLDIRRTSEFEHPDSRRSSDKGRKSEFDREITSEAQTDHHKWGPTPKKRTTCSHLDPRRTTEFDDDLLSPARASNASRSRGRSLTQNRNSENSQEMCANMNLPLLTSNLPEAIYDVIENVQPSNIALTILLQINNLYHINVSVMRTGQSLGCLYATEECIIEANRRHVFEDFLTFFVVDSMNTMEQKNKILSHSFDYVKN
ncbi:hypothetical protein GQX74_002319 [Glossina fuscipes]|nr:hypothetical protein GQX74_002319 [Glossina fuscipes]